MTGKSSEKKKRPSTSGRLWQVLRRNASRKGGGGGDEGLDGGGGGDEVSVTFDTATEALGACGFVFVPRGGGAAPTVALSRARGSRLLPTDELVAVGGEAFTADDEAALERLLRAAEADGPVVLTFLRRRGRALVAGLARRDELRAARPGDGGH